MAFTPLNTDDPLPEILNTVEPELFVSINEKLGCIGSDPIVTDSETGRAVRWFNNLTNIRSKITSLLSPLDDPGIGSQDGFFYNPATGNAYGSFGTRINTYLSSIGYASGWITDYSVSNKDLWIQLQDALTGLTRYKCRVVPTVINSGAERTYTSAIDYTDAWENVLLETPTPDSSEPCGLSYVIDRVGKTASIKGPTVQLDFDLTGKIGAPIKFTKKYRVASEPATSFDDRSYQIIMRDSNVNGPVFDVGDDTYTHGGEGFVITGDNTAGVSMNSVYNFFINITEPDPEDPIPFCFVDTAFIAKVRLAYIMPNGNSVAPLFFVTGGETPYYNLDADAALFFTYG